MEEKTKKGFDIKTIAFVALLFVALFFMGKGIACTVAGIQGMVMVKETTAIVKSVANWGLGFGEQGQKPTGNTTVDELKRYHAYYISNSEKKVLYLTFDCGYENGNTEKILQALKKHHAHATFFVVGHYLESSPEIVKQMLTDGNTVGNHTYHHPDMATMSTKEEFAKEIQSVEKKYKEITGKRISMYYRPPRGVYSLDNLKMAKEMGYQTFFWSLAYVDWNQDSQPSHEEAFSKLVSRVHPGAIILLHNTSKTNGEILDELLTKYEKMGYRFRTLKDFKVK